MAIKRLRAQSGLRDNCKLETMLLEDSQAVHRLHGRCSRFGVACVQTKGFNGYPKSAVSMLALLHRRCLTTLFGCLLMAAMT